MKPIDDAVFKTIFENTFDALSFEKAIAESLPNEQQIKALEDSIKQDEKELNRINKELNKLVDLALQGTLSKETIHSKELELRESKSSIKDDLEEKQIRYHSMPNINRLKQDAEKIRQEMLQYFSGKTHLSKMSHNEKQQLLHWLFDGNELEQHRKNKRGHSNDSTENRLRFSEKPELITVS